MSRLRCVVSAWGVALIAACGGDGTSTGGVSTARLRYVHAVADTGALDVRVRGVLRTGLTAVSFGVATDYESVTSGVLSVSSQPAPSTSADVPRSIANLGTIAVRDGASVTLVAIGEARDTISGRAAGIGAFLDDVTKPVSGQSRVRLINASPDAGAVDVYATLTGSARSVVPTFGGVDYRSALTRTLAPGSYALKITALSDTSVTLATATATLADGGAQTMVIRGYAGALPAGVPAARRLAITSMVNVAP